MSLSLCCMDKQTLGYIIHEARTLSRVRSLVSQFAGSFNYRLTVVLLMIGVKCSPFGCCPLLGLTARLLGIE